MILVIVYCIECKHNTINAKWDADRRESCSLSDVEISHSQTYIVQHTCGASTLEPSALHLPRKCNSWIRLCIHGICSTGAVESKQTQNNTGKHKNVGLVE